MLAKLILDDGTIFKGEVFGAKDSKVGEVVFNTGMTGYQEVLTDPSYAGQIVVMTYPLIGNYGINPYDFESNEPYIRGFIVSEKCDFYSNYQARESLDSYLEKNNIVGLSGIDTRALTKHLRSKGTMKGMITLDDNDQLPTINDNKSLVHEVTTKKILHVEGKGPKLVVMDFGMKKSIVKGLQEEGFDIYVVPSFSTFDEIMEINPKGIFLSNGPGDPKMLPETINTIKSLIGKVPICGICLGHQLLALALGADTYKLKFGHRGVNHPVKDLITNRVYITSQNHGYAVDKNTLPSDIQITHINLNDQTVEGMKHKNLPIYSVQYHPEAAPGPEDNSYLFKEFKEVMGKEV